MQAKCLIDSQNRMQYLTYDQSVKRCQVCSVWFGISFNQENDVQAQRLEAMKMVQFSDILFWHVFLSNCKETSGKISLLSFP